VHLLFRLGLRTRYPLCWFTHPLSSLGFTHPLPFVWVHTYSTAGWFTDLQCFVGLPSAIPFGFATHLCSAHAPVILICPHPLICLVSWLYTSYPLIWFAHPYVFDIGLCTPPPFSPLSWVTSPHLFARVQGTIRLGWVLTHVRNFCLFVQPYRCTRDKALSCVKSSAFLFQVIQPYPAYCASVSLHLGSWVVLWSAFSFQAVQTYPTSTLTPDSHTNFLLTSRSRIHAKYTVPIAYVRSLQDLYHFFTSSLARPTHLCIYSVANKNHICLFLTLRSP
jgi:hypothetical protein